MKAKYIRALLIDGNPGNVRLIRDVLAEAKRVRVSLECVDRLSVGLKCLAKGKIDLVLLNLYLSDSQGLDTVTSIKAEFPQIPMLILTVAEDEALAVKAVLRGAQDYLVKEQINSGLLLRSMRYAFERKQTENELYRVNRLFRMVSECNRILVHTTDEMDLLHNLCRIIVEIGGYHFAWVGFVKHDKDKTVSPIAHSGHEDGCLKTLSINWANKKSGFRATGKAVRIGKPCLSKDTITDNNYQPWCAETGERSYVASIALPLIAGGRVFGTLNIYATSTSAFDTGETKLLTELAYNLAYGIMALRTGSKCQRAEKELEKNFHKLRRISDETVNALASTFEKRDPYTAGHQKRVVQLATAIAKEMGLSEEQVEGIRVAGTLHDIGKIHVPAEILTKPSQLNDTEFNFIKTHPQVGYEILKEIEFAWPIAKIVLCHHERMNGSGYPFGLSGEKILLEARIIAVADVIEAISSHRPYRPALGINKALTEISQNMSTLYDPVAAGAALELFNSKEFRFSR